MNLLENLAGGLRSAAGVLNPDIQKQTFAADERTDHLRQLSIQQQQQALIQQVATQVQNGAMTPEQGTQALVSRGINPQGFVGGPSVEAQAKLEALKNERGFREAAIAAQGDPEKLVLAASQFGKPELVMAWQKAQEDRAERLQRAKEANDTRLFQIEQLSQNTQLSRDQQAQIAAQRDETARRGQDLQRLISESSNETRRIIAALSPGRQEKLVPVEQPDGTVVYTPQSEAAGGRVPNKGAGGKPLPTKLQGDLIEQGKILDASERFTTTFKKEFGGYVSDVIGNAALTAERKLSSKTERPQWWQDYELHQSVVRNKLFGSALTAPEIAAWEKSAISPGMHPDQIKANLARREKIEREGLTRLARSSATTYNRTAIEEAIGRPIPSAEAAPRAPGGAPGLPDAAAIDAELARRRGGG